MKLLDATWFRKYVIPGAIFQSVLVGGGYGTGREIVEYFTRFGAGGGVQGLAVTVVFWWVVLAVTWELARVFRVYDYRAFFQRLLGRGWVAYEALFLVMFLLVLAVVASAAGEILRTQFGVPYGVGIAGMLALVGTLAFFGREVVTKSLAIWTLFLYGMFAFYFVVAMVSAGSEVASRLTDWEVVPGWGRSGFQYAAYNLFIVPALLFSTRELASRREVVASAGVAALLCGLPALMFHVTFLGDYPAILTREIPVHFMITSLGVGALLAVYLVALLGTFVETGGGLIQGTIERVDGFLQETRGSSLTRQRRTALALGAVALSALLSSVGIIRLVAQGYGTLAWGFFAVYVVPVLTVGVWKIRRSANHPAARPAPALVEGDEVG